MAKLVKHVEGRSTHYLVPLEKVFDDHASYLDASYAVFDAIKRDRDLGYATQNGPNFAIEAYRAEQYAAYVAQYAMQENLHKFDTKYYRCVVFAVSTEQASANQRATR